VATHDYVIANGTGAAVRSDLNGALAAIVSQNSSATEPSPTYAYQRWADTTAGVMKMRNGANSAWITLYQLDGEWSTIAFENGSAAAPSIYFKDSGTDTGIYSPGADQVGISTGGTMRLSLSTTAVSSALAIDHPLGAVGTPSITFTGDLNTGIYSPGADTLAFVEGGAEAMRIDSSSRLLVGTSSAPTSGSFNQFGKLVVQGNTFSASTTSVLSLNRGEGAATITVGEEISVIAFGDSDGGTFGLIQCVADASAGASDFPGRLVFSTTADGAASPTEAMRINNQRELLIGTTTRTANGGVLQVSNGITFPATAVACTDVNTLDDYEEGTWTPGQGTGVTAVGAFSSVGRYTKIGRVVNYEGYITAVTSVAFNPAGGNFTTGLPFTVVAGSGTNGSAVNSSANVFILLAAGGTAVSGSASIAATSVIYFSGQYIV